MPKKKIESPAKDILPVMKKKKGKAKPLCARPISGCKTGGAGFASL